MDTPALDEFIETRRHRANWGTNEEPNMIHQIDGAADRANLELAALKSELAAKDELLAECARVIAPFIEIVDESDSKENSIGYVGVTVRTCRAAAELAKKLEGMK